MERDQKHKEAFALMWYGCDCGHRERFWNSRDGVTPFGTSCPSCGSSNMRHVDWHQDQRATGHIPYVGQRVWRDGTPDEAESIIRARAAAYVKLGHEMSPEEIEELVTEARRGGAGFSEGWPKLEITTADRRAVLELERSGISENR